MLLSNGPGDPAATGEYAVPEIRKLVDSGMPVFGICLGHQMLSLALGAKTVKMDQGHHGANHPVKDLTTGKVEIVSMNHGFTVDRDSLPEPVVETHVSLFDGTNAGIALKDRPVFSRPAPPGSLARPHRQPLPVRALRRPDGRPPLGALDSQKTHIASAIQSRGRVRPRRTCFWVTLIFEHRSPRRVGTVHAGLSAVGSNIIEDFKMNTLLKTLLATAIVSAIAAPAMAQTSATQSTTATVKIVQPITLTKNSDLAFGTVVKPTSGSNTVTIANASDTPALGGGGNGCWPLRPPPARPSRSAAKAARPSPSPSPRSVTMTRSADRKPWPSP